MALPKAEITLIGQPFVEELVMRSPHIDRFVPFPGFPGIAEQFFDARQTVQFFQQMQAEQFDLVVQMHGSLEGVTVKQVVEVAETVIVESHSR
jgi:ADP-heptose:LPS heptosyltransferase